MGLAFVNQKLDIFFRRNKRIESIRLYGTPRPQQAYPNYDNEDLFCQCESSPQIKADELLLKLVKFLI